MFLLRINFLVTNLQYYADIMCKQSVSDEEYQVFNDIFMKNKSE